MSSDNKIKFVTQDSSKGAGIDITSDVIAMPDHSTDHVLNVKTDASCVGEVNVQLEMSPDGQNWCPAVTKTITAQSGASITEIIGNEEYVKLTPDAGEFKNKHARGGLNFDVNGAVVTPDGSGARDLMDQHIAVNKSFNYSQWFKTSEAPTNTYKPVLFRHGGYDDFENTKVIQLTDAVTQNLCEPGVDWNAAGVSVTNTGYLQTTSASTLTYDDAFSISFWVKFNSVISSANLGRDDFFVGFTYGSGRVNVGGSPTRYRDNALMIQFRGTNGTNFISFGGVYASLALPTQIDDGNWHNVIIVKAATSHGASGVPVTDFGIGAAANLIVYIDGSAATPGQPSAGPGPAGNTAFNDYKMGGFVHDASSGGNILAAQAFKTDEVVLWKGHALTSAERTTIINSGVPNDLDVELSNVPSNYYRFENTSDLTVDTKSNTALTVSNASTLSLTSESIYAEKNAFLNLFRTNVNLSISGWFKTESGATGTLFSNTEGAAATGLKLDVSGSSITASYLGTVNTTSVSGTFNDGNWHHLVFISSPGSQLIVVDNTSSGTSNHTLTDSELKGSNGFTLLGDGQNNANAISPASTDSSKLNATLSNWSLHSEVLDQYAIAQLYSNGHVRNIKNLPSVDPLAIEAWWQLNDQTTPEQDLIGTNNLLYQDGNSTAKTLTDPTILVPATEATLVQDTINGNAITLSLTKNFNFSTNTWVTTADQDTAICLSLNGFEEQAEHVALWKCSQTIAGSTIDICDGGWHNVVLSYRGNNDLVGNNVAEGDTVKFGPGPANNLPFNWAISFDGQPLTAIKDGSGADFINGNGAIVTDTYNSISYNVGFNIYNRHLKYQTSNTEEVYKPHAQFSAGIHEAQGVDNNNAFQGSVDETSFHSDCWWIDQAGTSIIQDTYNQEKVATLYGNTTALTNRGAGSEYPEGVPYPLLNPELIGSASGGNQWINPARYDASTNPNGGLEGWWRWGDTPGDCSITINDVRDHEDSVTLSTPINARDIAAFGIVTADRQDMTITPESIYNSNQAAGTTPSSILVTYPQVVVSSIQAGVCNLKQMVSPVLKYLRVKFTGAGSCNLGTSSTEAQINFKIKG